MGNIRTLLETLHMHMLILITSSAVYICTNVCEARLHNS